MTRVFRVQDFHGRGPYRPGTSHRWTDAGHEARNPTFFEEFPGIVDKINYYGHRENTGCAFRTLDQLRAWFSEAERARLAGLGYRIVSMNADRVIAESKNQIVFGRRKHFSRGAVEVPWGAVLLVAACSAPRGPVQVFPKSGRGLC